MSNFDVIMTYDDNDVQESRLNVSIISRAIHIQEFGDHLKEIYIPEIMMSPPESGIWTMIEDVKAEFSYTYEIVYWPGPSKMAKIRQWLDEMRIPCNNINRVFFFKTDEDRLLFMMVWG